MKINIIGVIRCPSMMNNSTLKILQLVLLLCVIPRKSFGATIVPTKDADTTATVSTQATNYPVAATDNADISLLIDMMENIQSMDEATSARLLHSIAMILDEVHTTRANNATLSASTDPNSTVAATTDPNYTVAATADPNSTVADTADPNSTVAATADPNSTVADTADPNSKVEATTDPNSTVAATADPNSTVAATANPNSTVAATANPNSTVAATANPNSIVAATTDPNFKVADTVISVTSILKDVIETVQVMEISTYAGFDVLTRELQEVRTLPYNISYIKQEVLENLNGTQARMIRVQNIFKVLVMELKSGCKDIIMIYDNNSDDDSVELINYTVSKFIKLARDVEETLNHVYYLLTGLQEVFPKTTRALKVYDGEIERIKKKLENRKNELQETETIKKGGRRIKRFTCDDSCIVDFAKLAAAIAGAFSNTARTNAAADANNAYKAARADIVKATARVKATITSAHVNAANARSKADAAIARVHAKTSAAREDAANARAELAAAQANVAEANAAAAAIAHIKVSAANARSKDELILAYKIVNSLEDIVSGLDVANKELSINVQKETSLIDDWKAKLQTTLRAHENSITPEDIKWDINIIKKIIKKNLKALIKSCENFLDHVLIN